MARLIGLSVEAPGRRVSWEVQVCTGLRRGNDIPAPYLYYVLEWGKEDLIHLSYLIGSILQGLKKLNLHHCKIAIASRDSRGRRDSRKAQRIPIVATNSGGWEHFKSPRCLHILRVALSSLERANPALPTRKITAGNLLQPKSPSSIPSTPYEGQDATI